MEPLDAEPTPQNSNLRCVHCVQTGVWSACVLAQQSRETQTGRIPLPMPPAHPSYQAGLLESGLERRGLPSSGVKTAEPDRVRTAADVHAQGRQPARGQLGATVCVRTWLHTTAPAQRQEKSRPTARLLGGRQFADWPWRLLEARLNYPSHSMAERILGDVRFGGILPIVHSSSANAP